MLLISFLQDINYNLKIDNIIDFIFGDKQRIKKVEFI